MTEPYTPTEDQVRDWCAEGLGEYRDVMDVWVDRFLARVKRDAAREALDGLAAAEYRATRAEAQSAIRGRAVAIYQRRAREAEAERDWNWRSSRHSKIERIKANARADRAEAEARTQRHRADDMEDNTLRAQSNTRAMEERARRAEARTRVVRDVLGHLDPHAARLLREALDGDA